MNTSEQRKLLAELRYVIGTMTRDDREKLEMLLKRQKDDEDLDQIAQRNLERLAAAYLQRKSRKDVEEMWKKLTSGTNDKHSG